MRTISVPALRRLVVSAQAYVSRARRANAGEVEAAIRRASCIQLDSRAVEQSHRIVLGSLDRLRRTIGLETVVR